MDYQNYGYGWHDSDVDSMSQIFARCPYSDVELVERIEYLLFVNKDLSMKKKFLKSLDKIDCEQQLLSLTTQISSVTRAHLLSHSIAISTIRGTSDVVKLLSELSLKTLTIVEMNFSIVIEFYLNALNAFNENLRHASNKKCELSTVDSLHFLLQTLLVVIEKSCSFKEVDRQMMRKLYYTLRRLLKYEQIPLNTTNNCGLLVVSIDYYYLELTSSFRLLKRSLNFATKEHLALCYGFVTVVPAELLTCTLDSCTLQNSSLFTVILKSISSLFNIYPNDCIILTSCLKILCVMTQRLPFSKINISSDLMSFVISFLWTYLDHFQDVIKHLTRICASNLVAQKDDYCIGKLLELIESSKELDRRTCVLILCLNNNLDAHRVLSHRPTLPLELLAVAKRDVSHSYISQTFISLLVSSYYDIDLETWLKVWIEPLLSFENVSTVHLNNALSEALKLSPKVAEELLKFCRSAEKRSYLNAVNCVLALNKHSLVESRTGNEEPMQHLWRNRIPFSFMADAVRQPGSREAVATINLILESCKKNTWFTNDELELFRVYFDSNICNLNNNQRSIFLPLAGQIIDRLAGENTGGYRESRKITDLFSWLSNRCFENLYSGASFSRRCIALKVLDSMQHSNVWRLETCEPKQKYLIFTHLVDSFDENKSAAKSLIQQTSFPSEFLNEEQLRALYTNIVDMISGARFCEHRTAVYLLELFLHQSSWSEVYRNCFTPLDGVPLDHSYVDELVDVCRDDNRYYYPLCVLAEVLDNRLRSPDPKECLSTRPVYGFLVVAKLLFEHVHARHFSDSSARSTSAFEDRWRKLIVKFSKLCVKSNSLSATVVSQSSPEGYLPQDELELMLEDSYSCYSFSQRLLLVSWRTVKEASLMLAFFVDNFTFPPVGVTQRSLVDDELVLEIGSHLESLIRGIKHRGAFEQVYIALCQYCRYCWRCSTNETINSLPQKWLANLAVCIESEEGGEELCLLRRSAGVPCIAQAILSTEYDGNIRKRGTSHLLDTFVNTLLNICGRETDAGEKGVKESKIHAANILRALFRNKDLDEQMSSYVERGLVLALQGVQSPFWNERNVSWLLFSSLMTKIFGVARCKREISAKNKMTVKTFFRRYPSLYTFFQKRLLAIGESETSKAYARSSLYPILLVFQRLEVHSGCSREQYDTFELNSFIPLLFECSRSPVWKIRELVVSAIFPFVTIDIYEKYVGALWNRLSRSEGTENFLHGMLLQLETFLANVSALGSELRAQMQPLLRRMLEDCVHLLDEYTIERSNVIGRQFSTVVTWLVKLGPRNAETANERLVRALTSRLEESLEREWAVESTICTRFSRRGMHSEDLMATSICVSASHRVEDAISFVENFVTRKGRVLRPSEVVLEAICRFVCEDEFVPPSNTRLRNMRRVTRVARERARRSHILYSYATERIRGECNDCDSHLVRSKILRAFIDCPKWLTDTRTETSLTTLLERGDVLVEDSLDALVQCAVAVTESSGESTDVRFTALKTLTDNLRDTYSEDLCEVLAKFYFRCCHSISWQNQRLAVLRLSAWTLILRYALSPSSHFIRDDLNSSSHVTMPPSSMEMMVKAFYVETESELLFAAVAFTSWILRHFGILCRDENANTIFVQNVSHFLEDDIIISRLASTYLNRVVAKQPNVLRSPLSDELSQWIGQQCAFGGNNFSSLNQVLEFVTGEYAKQAANSVNSNSLLRADSWRSTMLSSKMHLLSDIGVIKKIPH